MTYNNPAGELAAVLFLFLGIFLILFIPAFCILKIKPFIEKRNYYKLEMSRSEGREHKFWKRKLKKLYIRSIPLIGRFYK